MKFFCPWGYILATLFAVAFGQDSKTCPGGVSQGSEVVSGAYYYKCDGDLLVPAGCIADDGSKVPIGGTFNAKNTQKTCLNNGGQLTVKSTACVTDDGKVVTPGSEVDAGAIYFSCQSNGEGFDLQVAGCLVDGKRVAVGEKYTKGDQVVICQRSTNKDASTVAGGCEHNGQTYDIGTQFQDDTAFYHCKKNGNGAIKDPVGCVADGKKVYDLDIFKKGDEYFRCRIKDSTVQADLWGCALVKPDGTIEPKSIACTWDTGSDPINYVNCCINKGGNAVITQLYCLYTYRGGRIQVNEGCYRVFDKTAAGCSRQSDGTLSMKTWDASDVSNSLAAGLHQC